MLKLAPVDPAQARHALAGGFDNCTTGSSKRSRCSLQPGMTPAPITFFRPQNRGAVIQALPREAAAAKRLAVESSNARTEQLERSKPMMHNPDNEYCRTSGSDNNSNTIDEVKYLVCRE
jgi:hypothetical protein